MSISVLQAVAGTTQDFTTVGSHTATVTINGVTAGSTLVVVRVYDCGFPTTITNFPTDNQGDTYHDGSGLGNGQSIGADVYYAYNVTGGNTVISQAVSVGCCCGAVGSTLIWLGVFEIAGLGSSDPLDAKNHGSGVSATSDSGALITAVANEIIVGATGNGLNGRTPSAGSGFSNLIKTTGITLTGAGETEIVSSTGTYHATFGWSASTAWQCAAATFKASSGATVTISDTGLTVTDSLASRRIRALSDTGLTVTDSVASRRLRALADTGATISDTVAAHPARPITDTGLTVSDSIAVSRLRQRSLLDTGLTISDSITTSRARMLADTGLTVADAISTADHPTLLDIGLTVVDTLGSSRVHLLADTGLAVSDAISSAKGGHVAVTDTGLVVADSIQKITRKLLIDTGLTVTDSIMAMSRGGIADTGLTISDSISKAVEKFIADRGVTISDLLSIKSKNVIEYVATSTVISYSTTGEVIQSSSSEIKDQPAGLPA